MHIITTECDSKSDISAGLLNDIVGESLDDVL
jgi:hypothetical protein